MAENLVDGEFWLPLQFLSDTDDDDLTTPPLSSKSKPSQLLNNGEDTFPYGFTSSDFSSPVDSLTGSSETESDEDEQYMAELTRRMARSTLQVGSKASDNNNLGRFVSGSPQSTLCAFGSGCKCRKGSSHGSPNGVCEVSSSKATWDLLHAAAGEVERMRLNQQQRYNSQNEAVVSQTKHSPIPLPSQNNTVLNNHEMGYFPQQSLSHQQLQIAQIQMLRQQQMAKQQNSMWGGMPKQCGGVFEQRQANQPTQNRGRNVGDVNVVDRMRDTSTLGLSSSAWPTLQHAKQQQFYNQVKQQQIQNQQYGSGMRAVFLGNGSGRRESAGTGVFLPRRVDSPVESRKKSVCSTALVPARVAQALNLNLDEYVVGQQQQHMHLHRFNSSSNVDNAVPPRHRGNYVISLQKHGNNISRPQAAAVSNEISLPQEWTY